VLTRSMGLVNTAAISNAAIIASGSPV
jgi:hypothetical protein